MKKRLIGAVSVCLLSGALLFGCQAEQTASVQPSSPEPTDAPAFTPATIVLTEVPTTPTPTPKPTPSPTPTATPTATPTPTPSPTPTPTPHPALAALMMDQETLTAYTFRRGSARLYDSPSEGSEYVTITPATNFPDGNNFLLLEDGSLDDAFLYVRYLRTGATGYVRSEDLAESRDLGGKYSSYGFIARPNAIFWSAPHLGYAKSVSREGYEAVRVLGFAGSTDTFAYVVSERGTYGYVNALMVAEASREDLMRIFEGSKPEPGDTLNMEAVAEAAASHEGEPYLSGDGAFLYGVLKRAGLDFNPYYYELYQKPLGDKTLYPRLYTDPVYNSMGFKLFNTSGWFVEYNGKQTEWEYLSDSAELQPGDLLFFAAPAEKGASIQEELRVVFRGSYSGYITSCGIYLGNDRMITVKGGFVTLVEGVFAAESEYSSIFDSARRILPTVENHRSFVIETLISNIYDRLGVPYSNSKRLSDRYYDCSSMVCWSFGSMGFKRYAKSDLFMDMKDGETTAAGFANLNSLYWDTTGETIPLNLLSKELNIKEDVDRLERGDIVFTRSTSRGTIGHIMVYLGNNTVIHSTTVDPYRGTMISEIRPSLRALYSCARRLGDF